MDPSLSSRLHGNLLGLIGLLLVGGWFALLGPHSIGGSAGYVLVSGHSMDPTMHTGDLVITRRQARYEVGDVIAFRIPKGDAGAGAQVIHRIVGGSAAQGYVTRGDNNDKNDFWRPQPEDIVGKRYVLLPAAGTIVAELRSPVPLALIAAVIAMWAVLGDDARKRRSRRSELSTRPLQ
ncbi:MAG TPA: signal peptidase I [Ilumatobacter sp.]|nr:signal peptidase I [Ilumatobacter sp.]